MLYVYDNYSQILDGIQAVGVITGAALAVVNPAAGVGVIAATLGTANVSAIFVWVISVLLYATVSIVHVKLHQRLEKAARVN
jgi:hypothetical protein